MTQDSCPICDGSEIEVYVEAPEAALNPDSLGSSRVEVSHSKILRCRRCGFGFLAARLTETELASLYAQLDHTLYEAESDGRARTAVRHFNIVRRFMGGGNLLDVGCASGGFLNLCAQHSFRVTGVEPAKGLADRAAQLLKGRGEILCATLQEAGLEEGSFDGVTLWDVLEHVPQPIEFLKLSRSLLKPGGFLLVNVPDLGSLQAKCLGRRWPLLLPEHFNYFTRGSLARAGAKSGLDLVRFGRRPASFSVGYILHRLSQHHLPGTRLGRRLVEALRLGSLIVPVPLGETWVVWRRVR
jgi:SAM-dependent methyltransferase